MLRPISIALALSSLTACSMFEDPVSRQMSYNGETQWFAREKLSQKILQPGQPVDVATTRLEKWDFESSDRAIGPFSDRLDDTLSSDALIYIKGDFMIGCGLRRHVIIEHEDGKITDAFGTTSESGCL